MHEHLVIQEKLRLLSKSATLSCEGKYEEARKTREHCMSVTKSSEIENLCRKYGEQR